MPLPSGSQQHSEAERQAWLDEDEDDVDETIGSTQLDAADGIDQLVHYGNLDARIVGVRFVSFTVISAIMFVCHLTDFTIL